MIMVSYVSDSAPLDCRPDNITNTKNVCWLIYTPVRNWYHLNWLMNKCLIWAGLTHNCVKSLQDNNFELQFYCLLLVLLIGNCCASSIMPQFPSLFHFLLGHKPIPSHPTLAHQVFWTDLMRVQEVVVVGVLSAILRDLRSQNSFTTGDVHPSRTRISHPSLFSTGIYLMPDFKITSWTFFS